MYALASVVGQLFIYFTITEFDALVLSTVTTTRKIFSTVYSVLRHPSSSLAGTLNPKRCTLNPNVLRHPSSSLAGTVNSKP
jgi:hypothetical protein